MSVAVSAAQTEMTGVRKAAILMVLLGDEAAAALYKHLSEEDLRQVTAEIADLEYISADVAAKVLQEYHRLALTQQYLSQGGPDYAHKLLVKAFGESGARSLLEQVIAYSDRKVTAKDVGQVLGAIEDESLAELASAVAGGDALAALKTLDRLLTEGKDLRQLLHNLAEYLRDLEEEAGQVREELERLRGSRGAEEG